VRNEVGLYLFKVTFDTKLNQDAVLEIGCFTGFSAMGWAYAVGGHPDGKVVTCEFSEKYAKIASDVFEKTGTDKIISVVIGDARES
jgi:predicted O-methyltransferase YrrM